MGKLVMLSCKQRYFTGTAKTKKIEKNNSAKVHIRSTLLNKSRRIQSNKTEQKTNRTQSNSNRSIGFGNRTKSN